MSSSELESAIQLANEALPLPILANKRGIATDSKGYADCPFCEGKKKFQIKKGSGSWYYRCFHTSCSAHPDNNSLGKDAIGLISMIEKVERKDAMWMFLDQAGVPRPNNQQDSEPKKKPEGKKQSSKVEGNADEVIRLTGEPEASKSEDPSTYFTRLEPESRNPWEEVYRRMTLTEEHRQEIKEKRGLSDETIDRAGIRSSIADNKNLLQGLDDIFDRKTLLREGILQDWGHSIKISPQLTGYGNTGKKDKDTGDYVFEENTNPTIIPYSKDSECIYLRPHKGGISGKKWRQKNESDFELNEYGEHDSSCSSHVYCEALLEQLAVNGEIKRVVLTEGEYKALALFQCGIAAIAVPGITFIKNPDFRRELVGIIKRFKISDLVVIYDNEVKDDAALASYQDDPWKRYEAEVWARYACSNLHYELAENGGKARLGFLRDEWRNEKGKADFDGVLAMFVKEEGSISKGTRRAASEFKKIIKEAEAPSRFLPLFPTEKERIIQAKLARLHYKRRIPVGDQSELRDAEYVGKCHDNWRIQLKIDELQQDLKDCFNVYYWSKPPAEKRRENLAKYYNQIREAIDACDENDKDTLIKLKAARRACWIQQKGWPEVLTDFTLQSEYKVITHDRKVERLFVATNHNGEQSRPVQPKNTSLASSMKFREWLLDCGNFHWRGGDNQLQLLMTDLDHYSAWKEIREIDLIGFDPESKLYIYGDCAITPEGHFIFPDDNDIIWYESIGYRVDPDIIKNFGHGAPKLFQSEKYASAKEEYASINWEEEALEVSEIFSTMMKDFYDSFGDHAGTLALGASLSYGFAPYMIRKFNATPGLWIHGRMSGGKTTICRWLMNVWGFPPGFTTITMGEGTTNTGMDRVLSQYCGLPVWFDEFRLTESTTSKMSSIRNAYNQQSKSKARIDQSKMTRSAQPLTMPIVSGEGTVQDAATKSRFVSVVLSASNRLPFGDKTAHSNRYNRQMNDCKAYYRIGRWILRNRAMLTDTFGKSIDNFVNSPTNVQEVSQDRLRLTYGTAYCAIQTISASLKASGSSEFFKSMKPFTFKHANEATHDVSQEAFIHRFFGDIITGVKRGAIDKAFLRVEYAIVEKDGTGSVKIKPCMQSHPGAEIIMRVASREAFADYATDQRRQGHEPELDRSNLQSEMKKEPFWIVPPTISPRAHRMSVEGKQVSVWAFRVSEFEDEELRSEIETLLDAESITDIF